MIAKPIPSPPRSGGEGQGEGATFARSLRQQPTWAERTFWRELRDQRFGDFKFRRQHPVGPYVLDFYCVAAKLAIELDGDVHGSRANQEHDRARDRYLAERGIHVLRFWNVELLENRESVLNTIFGELQQRTGKNPHPDPLPLKGRGERAAQ
jgi:very-short-patch-repair endonuclease